MSLAQKMHFLQDMFLMTTIALMTHLNFLSKVVNHPDTLFFQYDMNLLIDGLFKFSFGLWIVFIHIVLQEPKEIKIWEVQIGWIQRSFRFTASADQLWCWLYVEFPHLVGTIANLDSHNMFQVLCIFKPKWFDYSMFWDGHPGHAFHRVQGPLKHLVWSFCAPVHTVIATDLPTEPEMCFIKEVGILFNLFLNHRHITKCFSRSAALSLCLIWIL